MYIFTLTLINVRVASIVLAIRLTDLQLFDRTGAAVVALIAAMTIIRKYTIITVVIRTCCRQCFVRIITDLLQASAMCHSLLIHSYHTEIQILTTNSGWNCFTSIYTVVSVRRIALQT